MSLLSNRSSQDPTRKQQLVRTLAGASVRVFSNKKGEDTSVNNLTRTDVHRMRVTELRDELDKIGLDSSGQKEVLKSRLLETVQSKVRGRALAVRTVASKQKRDRKTDNSVEMSKEIEVKVNLEKALSESSPTISGTHHINISPYGTYVLQFDGGSRGNPGTAGAGMVLYDEVGHEVWHGHHYLGESSTNNEAEYTGLLAGLQCARAMDVDNIVVQGDSELIVKQLHGKYKCKSRKLMPYFASVKSLIKGFNSFEIRHIPRAQNFRADELANEAMDWRENDYFGINIKLKLPF